MSDEPAVESRKLPGWVFPTLLIALSLALYMRCATFEFTSWDDDPLLTKNPVTAPFAVSKVFKVFVPGAVKQEQLYIPLTYLSHLLENMVAGVHPGVTHGINVLLHAANVLLVFLLLSRMKADPLLAFVCAIVFAAHPVQVETVAWGMGRKDLLSACLGLGSLLCWLAWLERDLKRDYGVAVALWCAAMLAKPSLIVLPGVFILLWAWRGKWNWRRVATAVGPLALPAIFILVINMWVDRSVGDTPPLIYRVACIPWLLKGWMARLLLLQPPLRFYEWPDLGVRGLLAIGVPLTLIVIAAVCMAVRWKKSEWWLGLGMCLIAFVPAAGLVISYRKFVTADRYAYFPIIGLCTALALGFGAWKGRRRTAGVIALVLFAGSCALRAWPVIGEWQNSRTLWQAEVDRGTPNKYIWLSLGEAYELAEELPQAISAYEKAVEMDPGFAMGWRHLGGAYLRAGKPNAAIDASEKALAMPGERAAALQNIGAAQNALGKHEEALNTFLEEEKLVTENAQLHMNLGLVYTSLGRFAEAEKRFASVVRLAPENEAAQVRLAAALFLQHKLKEAERECRRFLKKRPDHKAAQELLKRILESPPPTPAPPLREQPDGG